MRGPRGSHRGQFSHRRKPSRHGLYLLVLLLVPLYLALVTAAASLVHSSAAAPTARHPRRGAEHPARRLTCATRGSRWSTASAAGQGQPQLRFSAAAAALARLQSLAMARDGRAFHQSCLTCTKLRMVWGSIEENVASGTSAQAVYQQLTQGSAWRPHALCRCVTQGGTAVVRSGGRAWVTEIFFRPSSKILLGARAQPRPTDPFVTGDPDEDALLHLEAEIGRKLAIDHIYVHLGTSVALHAVCLGSRQRAGAARGLGPDRPVLHLVPDRGGKGRPDHQR